MDILHSRRMNLEMNFVFLCLFFTMSSGRVVNNDVLEYMKSEIDKILKWTDNNGRHVIYQGCPNGWITFYHSCYLIGGKKLNYKDAKEFCSAHNSYVVVVETKHENEFLKTFMRSIEGEQKETSYWLGLNENVSTGKWIWQEGGKAASFKDWGPSEPHPLRDEGCVWFEQIKGYRWSDVACGRKTTTLCEKRGKAKK